LRTTLCGKLKTENIALKWRKVRLTSDFMIETGSKSRVNQILPLML
jgi:hypothetical protein